MAEESKKLDKEQASLKKEETDLIAKKKLITPEEYKKNLDALRKKYRTKKDKELQREFSKKKRKQG